MTTQSPAATWEHNKHKSQIKDLISFLFILQWTCFRMKAYGYFSFFQEQPMFNHAPNHFWLIGLGQIPFFIFTLRHCLAIPASLILLIVIFERGGCVDLWSAVMKGPSQSLLLSDWSIRRNISLGFAATQGSYCTRQESGRIVHCWHLLKLRPMTHRLLS